MFASSSFQTHSIVLLHIISRIDKEIPIYFINTGFLFPETIAYKDQLAEEFGLNIINTKSDLPKSLQKIQMETFYLHPILIIAVISTKFNLSMVFLLIMMYG